MGTFISPDTLVPDPGAVIDYNRYLYARGNPLKYRDPDGHRAKIPCPLCDQIRLDYSNQKGLADTAIDIAATVGCFFIGCHVDREANQVTGPSVEEAANDAILGMVNPIGMVGVPGARGAGQVLTREEVIRALGEEVQPFLKQIREIAGEDALIGFQGSLARGTVGNPRKSTFGQPIDLTNFDVDAFIVSDKLRGIAKWGIALKT